MADGPTRYVVLGAGAVGGAIGFRLARAGRDVTLVARGAHGEAIRSRGLTLKEPGGVATATIACVTTAGEARPTANDVIILAVKTQDVPGAIVDLDVGVAVACAQNGVAAEPMVAARGARVYGLMSWIPAQHLEPGVVEVYAADPPGVFRLGCYPEGVDERAHRIAADLTAAKFDAAVVDDIMRWKRGKLLNNLGNVLDAFCERSDGLREIARRAAVEGAKILDAAGLAYVPAAELFDDMRGRLNHTATIDGARRAGGSTWQSLTRGKVTEVEHLNGWLCALADSLGIDAPINRGLMRLATEADGARSVPLARVHALIDPDDVMPPEDM